MPAYFASSSRGALVSPGLLSRGSVSGYDRRRAGRDLTKVVELMRRPATVVLPGVLLLWPVFAMAQPALIPRRAESPQAPARVYELLRHYLADTVRNSFELVSADPATRTIVAKRNAIDTQTWGEWAYCKVGPEPPARHARGRRGHGDGHDLTVNEAREFHQRQRRFRSHLRSRLCGEHHSVHIQRHRRERIAHDRRRRAFGYVIRSSPRPVPALRSA